MRILNLRRTSGAGSLVANFDLEATPEITMHDWQLRRTPKGFRVFPPSPRSGRSSASVTPRTIIDHHRPSSTISGLPGTGKSVITTDAACHVAAGMDWHGRKVRRAS